MTHDAQCEQRGHTLQVYQPDWCRCEVRALEAKLADAVAALAVAGAHCDRMAPLPDGRRSDDGKRFIEQHVGTTISVLAGRADAAEAKLAEAISLGRICLDGLAAAESRLARLRPVVRAAMQIAALASGEWSPEERNQAHEQLSSHSASLAPADIEWAKGVTP